MTSKEDPMATASDGKSNTAIRCLVTPHSERSRILSRCSRRSAAQWAVLLHRPHHARYQSTRLIQEATYRTSHIPQIQRLIGSCVTMRTGESRVR
jgi:hypothetical protein